MRENRPYGSEGGGKEFIRFSLPLSLVPKEAEEIEKRNVRGSHCLRLFSVGHFPSDIRHRKVVVTL